jgi:Nucleotidyltransferase domain
MTGDTSQALLDRLTAAFAGIGGVRAVVLGGSRGRGTHHAQSDYDIGLYYTGELDIAALEQAAQALNEPMAGRTYQVDDAGRALMTPVGGWGPWVNGGGWLTVAGKPVDILYRDSDRVTGVIGDVRAGRFECAYHYGHPHAFVSAIYAGEIATCRVLHDPLGLVAQAKRMLDPYPPALQAATIARFSDEARFFLAIAAKAATQGDIAFVAGCAFRAEACLMQIIFAHNRQWLINEKGALKLADSFAIKPDDLKARVEAALTLSADPASLTQSLDALRRLVDEAAGH